MRRRMVLPRLKRLWPRYLGMQLWAVASLSQQILLSRRHCLQLSPLVVAIVRCRHSQVSRRASSMNFIAKNDELTVNRWTTTGFLAASATTNETAWLTYKTVRSMGALVFDNQARV